ncbi:MAG TPA: SBBP repeat-containing protein [Oculatellaceae cyanobacterium]|jgi:Ca2+-binding RTX toxin-like protein
MSYPFIQFGSSGIDNPFGISTDSNSNLYVSGYTTGALPDNTNVGIPGSTTPNDGFIVKYNADGTLAWVEQFGTSSNDVASIISTDSNNNVYASGFTSGALPDNTNLGSTDAFIVKYDANGDQTWVRQFGTSSSDAASGIKTDSNNNVYATGSINGTVFNGIPVSGDAFIVKYDTNGNQAWFKPIATSGVDSGSGISIDSNNNVYATGITTGALPGNTNLGNFDAFIVKYDTNGNEAWVKQFGTSGIDRATSLSIDTNSNIYVTGSTTGAFSGTNQGSQDAFIAKYDASGTEAWVKQFGTSGNDRASSISTDSNGNVYVSIYTDGALSGYTNQGSNDAVIVKYKPDGTQDWARQFGTTGDDQATSITIGSNGNVYVTGTTTGTLAGNTTQGSTDAFIAAFDANGNLFAAPIVANPITDYTLPSNTPLNFTFAANTFSDVNNDTLSYTATLADNSALPAWLTFESSTRTFTSNATTIGNYTLKVTANDGNGGTVSDNFNLNIQTPTTGTIDADSFTSTSSSDVFYGLAGNDYILGSLGADYFDGGDGLDMIDYKNSTSGVTIDLQTGTSSGGYATGDTLINIERVKASNYSDTITGNDSNNHLYGYAGDDSLSGGAGKDYVYGGVGNDTINGGTGTDYLYGEAGDDTINGNDGNDDLSGGSGADALDGGIGNDTVIYTTSTAGVLIDLAASTASGGDAEGDTLSNIEYVQGSNYNDIITGNDSNNYLYGYAGDDSLSGGAGNDYVYGGDGIDTLTGANLASFGVGERDFLTGNAGVDTFVLGTAAGVFYNDGVDTNAGVKDYARILDFNVESDVVQLTKDFSYYLGAAPAGTFSGSGTGIFIDNDSTTGSLSAQDELIGVLQGVNLGAGAIIPGTTAGFTFV